MVKNARPFCAKPGVHHASGWPSNCEKTSLPCRWTTAGIGPENGCVHAAASGGPLTQLLCAVVPSGSAQ